MNALRKLAWMILGDSARPTGHIRTVTCMHTGEHLRITHAPIARDARGRVRTLRRGA